MNHFEEWLDKHFRDISPYHTGTVPANPEDIPALKELYDDARSDIEPLKRQIRIVFNSRALGNYRVEKEAWDKLMKMIEEEKP